jgi:hypothetical protein
MINHLPVDGDLGSHLDDWRLRRRFHAALERAGLRPSRPAGRGGDKLSGTHRDNHRTQR